MPHQPNDHDVLIVAADAIARIGGEVKQMSIELQRCREDVLVIRTERAAGKWIIPILTSGALTLGIHLALKFIH